MNKLFPILFLFVFIFIFFWQFFFKGLLPIPSDTIVGLYHPFRDFYADKFPRGIPYKNFLITDPVRQQYPWKNLTIEQEKKGEAPLWNPYSFSGTPLLSNFQSAAFYPLNLMLFTLPFNISWSIFIILEVLLASLSMFIFLKNLKLSDESSLLGSLVFSFSGFSIAWLEWGNILHTVLWLPLILFSIDKIFLGRKIIWSLLFLFSMCASFFAGHLQIFTYIFIVSFFYFIFRWFQKGKDKIRLYLFIFLSLTFFLFTFYQWIPALQFILESGRSMDQGNWQKLGWFVPWQNIVQFLVPDFFGNPTTLNYWGVFNYGEFIGYVGIMPLILALFSLFYKRDKNVFFFGSLFFVSLIFSFPTIFAKVPYILNIPLLSTSQPTRLLFLTDFSLSILCATGFNGLYKNRKGLLKIILAMTLFFTFVWILVIKNPNNIISTENIRVAENNLYFPSLIFVISSIVLFVKSKKINFKLISLAVILITVFDLFRFGWKFTPFTKIDYLYPKTSTIAFLQSQKGQFRIMSTDSRILSPNFSIVYKLQSIEGYDPLYIERYGEFVAALERDTPNINPPFGFNRIITPRNYKSELIDLLGVKYVLSLSDLSLDKLTKVFQEGETRVYENKKAFQRAFFVEETLLARDKQDSIRKIFDNKDILNKIAIVEDGNTSSWSVGKVQIQSYRENRIVLRTESKGVGFLVLMDSLYLTWRAKIDGKETKIIRTDYNFRGLVIPKGIHKVEFYVTLL